jgi:hypothetical protein
MPHHSVVFADDEAVRSGLRHVGGDAGRSGCRATASRAIVEETDFGA